LGGGTVLGGTISSADGTSFDRVQGIALGAATLDGVTIDADISMPGTGGDVKIRNGLTLNGRVRQNVTIGSALIRVDGPTRTIDGTGQIEFLSTAPGSSGNTGIIQNSLGGAGDLGAMTIGSGITVFGTGGIVGENGDVFPATLVNEGTIHSDRPGSISIRGIDWINNGTVRSSGGGALRTFDAWINNGTVRIGPGPFLDSDSDFTQSSTGMFLTEILSTSPDGYGKMIVDGTATLDGVLRIEFEDSYNPVVGDSFAILQYGTRVGAFALIEAPLLDPGLQIAAFYDESFLNIVIQQQ
jgi:hypothetical protein